VVSLATFASLVKGSAIDLILALIALLSNGIHATIKAWIEGMASLLPIVWAKKRPQRAESKLPLSMYRLQTSPLGWMLMLWGVIALLLGLCIGEQVAFILMDAYGSISVSHPSNSTLLGTSSKSTHEEGLMLVMTQISNPNIRIAAMEGGGACYAHVSFRAADGEWRTLLGTGLFDQRTMWQRAKEHIVPDPEVEWKSDKDTAVQRSVGVFTEAYVAADEKSLTLRGAAGPHDLTMTWTIKGEKRVYVTVQDRVKVDDGVSLGKVMTHLFFIPDGRASRSVEPLDFAWLPNLHRTEESVCGDHFFRSPAVAVYVNGLFAALVPDLNVFAQNCTMQHALDLRTFGTGFLEAPRLSYGLCSCEVDGHVYTKHDPQHTTPVTEPELSYAFDLFFGRVESEAAVSQTVTSFLWETYGHRFFQDVRPQVMPFAEYGRRYTYVHELVSTTEIGGEPTSTPGRTISMWPLASNTTGRNGRTAI